MENRTTLRSRGIPLALGLVLVAVGVLELAFRAIGVDVFAVIGERGWPLFVIVPGLVLLVLAIFPEPPKGVGFAVAGAVVTTVGGLLLYQSTSNDWESWAYLWAAIPLAVGLAMSIYGLVTGTVALVRTGGTVAAVAAAILAVGAWFFRGLFAGQDRALEALGGWPVLVIGVGVVLLLAALLPRGPVGTGRTPPA